MDITWENPPTSQRIGSADTDEIEIAAALKANPHVWARVFTYDKATTAGATASQINKGQRAAFRGGFEAKSRSVDGERRVYVRFVGTHQTSNS